MFDKLRQRIRARQAYMNAPVTYEVLGVEEDQSVLKWFRRNFGHQSVRSMFIIYAGCGLTIGIVLTALTFGEIDTAFLAILLLGGVIALNLYALRSESKKVG